MIRKTISITSIAILVATISVATSMTSVQADVDGDFVDISIPGADMDLFTQVEVAEGFEAQTFIVDEGRNIRVDISDFSEEVWIDMPNGAFDTTPIMVTISDIQWVDGPGAIGSFVCDENNGATSTAFFNKDTLEITITPGLAETAWDVHCDFEGFHGDVEKALDADCEVQIKDQFTTECSFTITYIGVPANVIDSVPAEWEVTGIDSNLDAVITYTDNVPDGTDDDTIDDIDEITITNPGVNVPTGGVFTFASPGTDATVLFTDGAGNGIVDGTIDDIDELSITFAGDSPVTEGTATLEADEQCVTVTKGNSGKAATGIECNDVTEVDTTVTIETRKSPGKGHKGLDRSKIDVFKPTFCGPFPVNDGAQAILLDGPGGDPVIGNLDDLPIVLDFTLEELATSVDTGDGAFLCSEELKPAV